MAQHYFDPKRENDPHALPDLEIFFLAEGATLDDGSTTDAGWFWQACFPGCLPDGEPMGPFASEAEALADARDGFDE